MKETGILGCILLAATTPTNLLLWGGLGIVCIGMYLAGEAVDWQSAEATKNAPAREATREDAGSQK